MYGENQVLTAVPVAAGVGAATMLPTTGAETLTSMALALAVGLVTWGVVYYYQVVRSKKLQ